MFKHISLIFSISFVFSFHAQIKKGNWLGTLTLEENAELPFLLNIKKNKKSLSATIINSTDTIHFDNVYYQNDTIKLKFPNFNSVLVFTKSNQKLFQGYWQNFNKGNNYKIPLTLTHGIKNRFIAANSESIYENIDGKWETTFDENTKDAYKGLGYFKQNQQKVSGTFLTETGDYGFLEGNAYGKNFDLSGFDGGHAFLFKSKIINDTLKGMFYSGIHFKGSWIAHRNDNFELRHADSITYIVNDEPLVLNLKDVNNKDFHYPNEQMKNKVIIIQIMGTWCSNCVDETKYFKELYEKYHSNGFEIISIGYENGEDFDDYAQRILQLKNKYNLNYTFLVGGSVKAKLVKQHFKFLNDFMSYPTSIFIDKKGNIRKIHTGFSGKGTGEYYDNFVKETDAFVKSLLDE